MKIQYLLNQILLHSEPGASGTGAPAPAAAPPAPEPASTPSDEGGAEVVDFDFAALAEPSDEDVIDEPAAQPEPTPAAAQPSVPSAPGEGQPPMPAPALPAATPQAPAPTGTPTSAQATPTPAAPQAPAPAAAPAAEPTPLTAQQVETAFTQYEANILPQLETQYKNVLTPELARELDETPATAIPKLAARIHYNAHIAAYTGIMSQLPVIVGNMLERQKVIAEAEASFFGRWPDLKNPQYRAQVDQGIRAYRAANPKATLQDITEKAGLMLMISLGLNPQPAQSPTAPAAAPAIPPAPAGRSAAGAPRPADRGAVDIWSDLVSDSDDS